MTETEIKAQREQLANTLKSLSESGQANTQAIAQVQEQLRALNQSVSALNLATNRAAEGEYGESAVYTHVDDKHVKTYPRAYVKTDSGVVRIASHVTERGGILFGLADDPNPRDAAQRHLQIAIQKRGIVRRVLAAARGYADENSPEIHTPECDWEVAGALRAMPAPIAKIFANSSGIGSTFIPTRTSPEFEREVLATNNLGSMFAVRAHPGGTLKQPYISGNLQAFAHAVPTTDDPSNSPALSSLGDGEDSITTSHLAVGAQVDRDADEDSIIAVLPMLYGDMADAMAFADDNCIVNGHTAGSQDALASWNVRGRLAVMTNNTAHQLRRFDGLRRKAIAASKTASLASAQTLEGFMSIVNLLGIEQLMGADGQSNVVILVNPEFFFAKMLKPSVFSEFSTYDKVGSAVALLTGKLGGAQMFGLPNQIGYLFNRFPVCLAYTITKDLNASGVWDNTTTTKTAMLVVDRTRYEQWLRKGATVETDVAIRNNTVTVVGRKRNTFRSRRVGSSQAVAAYGYELSLT